MYLYTWIYTWIHVIYEFIIHVNYEFIWFFHLWIQMFHEFIYEFRVYQGSRCKSGHLIPTLQGYASLDIWSHLVQGTFSIQGNPGLSWLAKGVFFLFFYTSWTCLKTSWTCKLTKVRLDTTVPMSRQYQSVSVGHCYVVIAAHKKGPALCTEFVLIKWTRPRQEKRRRLSHGASTIQQLGTELEWRTPWPAIMIRVIIY